MRNKNLAKKQCRTTSAMSGILQVACIAMSTSSRLWMFSCWQDADSGRLRGDFSSTRVWGWWPW